jgi:hypothetical protein
VNKEASHGSDSDSGGAGGGADVLGVGAATEAPAVEVDFRERLRLANLMWWAVYGNRKEVHHA